MSLMQVMQTPCYDRESRQAPHKYSVLQSECGGVNRDQQEEMTVNGSQEKKNGRRMLRDRENSFALPFLFLVWPSVQSVINHHISPDMARRCPETQSLCVCVWLQWLCDSVWMCVFDFSAKYWPVCACLFLQPRGSSYICQGHSV